MRVAPALSAAVLVVLLLIGCGSESKSDIPVERNNLGELRQDYNRLAPNIVVVMTDDQAMDTMKAMPQTRRLIGNRGVTFHDPVVSFPLCCPSRAAFLTGQYAHNNDVKDNGPPDGGIGALDQSQTMAVWLRKAGYDTTFVGKYLNGYGKGSNGGPTFIPPGWVHWYGLTASDKTSAYDYEINQNGRLVEYGDAPSDYKTDVLARLSAGSLRQSLRHGNRPAFLWTATSDPHTDNGLGPDARRNPLPAPRDDGSFKGETLPQPASFDEADVTDKPADISSLPQLSKEQLDEMETLYVSQLESLGAVDDLVARLVRVLADAGELRNTIFVFTSDNGFMRGQHRIDSGKSLIYQESLHVPLLISGPGFPPGTSYSGPVANTDLSPTLLQAAGAKSPVKQDGIPIQQTITADKNRPPVLVEIYGRKDGDLFGLRTPDFAYAEHADGFVELYALRRDPDELENVADQPRYATTVERLSRTLQRLKTCSGYSCR